MSQKKLEWYSIPHLLHIEMTYSCNSKCFFCYNPYRNSPIDYSMINRLVDSVAKSQIPHVYLIGGEPSLLNVEEINKYIEKLSPVSSLTIVTNGLLYMEGLSKKIACIGIALHGDKQTQEWLSGIKGGYERTIETISRYVCDGFDVRCIPVLTSKNFNQMYDIIRLAKEMGMESVFVDKFEIGGMGLDMANQLKPSLSQFKIALGQMIKARDDFDIPVGFGTAIPYCLDEQLIEEDMTANCGVGSTFCAVNPNGDLRICNQSEVVYGNILRETVEKIWNKKDLNDFRDLKWASEPCNECPLLSECTGGCKVDLSCSNKYCVDYHIRENKEELVSIADIKLLWKQRIKQRKENMKKTSIPQNYREFLVDPFLKLNTKHSENYVVTRYQTVIVDEIVTEVLRKILRGKVKEEELIRIFKERVAEHDIRKLLSELEEIEAIHSKLIESIDLEVTRDCNLKCPHCINGSESQNESIPFSFLIRSIGKLQENGLKEVSITGGEPFKYPRIFDLIHYLNAKDIRIRILTNATLITSEVCDKIKGKIDEIGISVDGTNATAHDFIRGKGSFALVEKAVKELKRSGVPFSFYSCLHRYNMDVNDLIKFAKKKGALYLKINEITKRGKAVVDYERKFKINIDEKEFKLADFYEDNRKCSISTNRLFVDQEGNCYPCVEVAQRGIKPFGNLLENSPRELFDQLELFVSRNNDKNCPYSLFESDFCTICLNNNYECESR